MKRCATSPVPSWLGWDSEWFIGTWATAPLPKVPPRGPSDNTSGTRYNGADWGGWVISSLVVGS